MNDHATPAADSSEGNALPVAAEATPSAGATPEGAAPARRRRGGRGGRRGRDATGSPERASAPAAAPAAARARRPEHPVLQWLALQHPALFGEQPVPLKRGIFQDLVDRHGEAADKDGLKVALSLHTRATRYLVAMASGQPRRDLDGQVAEPVAPEHVFLALSEVFRRRQQRSPEDLTPQWQRRLVQAIEASGLSREAYVTAVQVRDERTEAVLQAALSEVSLRDAKAEALLRAFDASGSELSAFADMYGLPRHQVESQLARARKLQAAATAPAGTSAS